MTPRLLTFLIQILMKTKTIPFNLETAKKIQTGKIKGKIKQLHGEEVEIMCWNLDNPEGNTLAVKHRYFDECNDDGGIHVDEYNNNGEYWDRSDSMAHNDLTLEVPDNEPQFKPFDKVLVRNPRGYANTIGDVWTPALFQTKFKYDFYGENYLASGIIWSECIPFAGNEHLVGTTDEQKEE